MANSARNADLYMILYLVASKVPRFNQFCRPKIQNPMLPPQNTNTIGNSSWCTAKKCISKPLCGPLRKWNGVRHVNGRLGGVLVEPTISLLNECIFVLLVDSIISLPLYPLHSLAEPRKCPSTQHSGATASFPLLLQGNTSEY